MCACACFSIEHLECVHVCKCVCVYVCRSVYCLRAGMDDAILLHLCTSGTWIRAQAHRRRLIGQWQHGPAHCTFLQTAGAVWHLAEWRTEKKTQCENKEYWEANNVIHTHICICSSICIPTQEPGRFLPAESCALVVHSLQVSSCTAEHHGLLGFPGLEMDKTCLLPEKTPSYIF